MPSASVGPRIVELAAMIVAKTSVLTKRNSARRTPTRLGRRAVCTAVTGGGPVRQSINRRA